MGDPKCIHICAYFCFAKVFSLFWGILCFRKFFSLSLFPSLFPLLLLVHLSSVTNSLLLYFSRSSCPFYSLCLSFFVFVSLFMALFLSSFVLVFFFFSLSLSLSLSLSSSHMQKQEQDKNPFNKRPHLRADLKDSEINSTTSQTLRDSADKTRQPLKRPSQTLQSSNGSDC